MNKFSQADQKTMDSTKTDIQRKIKSRLEELYCLATMEDSAYLCELSSDLADLIKKFK